MMSTENDTTSFVFHAPQKGTYLLDLFAAAYPTLEHCKKEEPIKYVNIARFKLNCHGVDRVSYKAIEPMHALGSTHIFNDEVS